jgi:hypothetical protein
MTKLESMKCKHCGEKAVSSLLWALIGDAGGKLSWNPAECPDSPDGKHDYSAKEDEEE